MARPKKNIKSVKSIQVNVRFTVDQFLLVSDSAHSLGIEMTEYIRRKSSGQAMPKAKINNTDRAVFVELSRIGNNINQITKKVHIGGHSPAQLQAQLSELKKALDFIKSNILGDDCKTD